MAGRLRKSYRDGNLSEHLGLLLLKGVAAVAEVPRTEDVGLDAVATLLRRDVDGNCYAEDGFVVQLKSSKTRPVEYRGHSLSWLIRQTQPMFIGLVSLSDSSIELYPTLHANQAVFACEAESVTLHFEKSKHPYPWAGKPEKSATVWLGEPLLKWTVADLTEKAVMEKAYQILKKFLSIARHEYELLSFGQCSDLSWTTNDLGSIQTSFRMIKGQPDDLKSLAEQCKPGLRSLLFHGLGLPEERRDKLMIPLLTLVVALRDLGVEVDPLNIFTRIFIANQEQASKET